MYKTSVYTLVISNI